jgi:hypothetical protein
MDPDSIDEREAPSSLPDWDYHTNLRLRRRLSIDVVACRQAARLADTVPLALSVRWNAVPSLLRGSAAWVPLQDNTHDYAIDVDIAGERLGGVVRLETMVVLAGSGEPGPARAYLAGSSLWNDSFEIRLQGNAPLFPMALVPFSESSLPSKAGWFLELGSDFHATALGAIQLLVNQDHPMVAAAIGRAGSPTEIDRAVLSALRSDIARTMIERALGDDTFEMTENFDKDTLGSILQGLIRTYMSTYLVDDDLTEIRRIRANDPPRFAAIVQAATGFLAGEM